MTLNVAQQIIYDALAGNITGDVTDDVAFLPEGMPEQDFPYTVIGDDSADPWDTDTSSGLRVTTNLHIWSRSSGSKECKTIMGEIYDLLHKAVLTKTGWVVVDCLCDFQEVMKDPDGETRHGVMRFRLTIYPEDTPDAPLLLEDGTGSILLEDGTELLLE